MAQSSEWNTVRMLVHVQDFRRHERLTAGILIVLMAGVAAVVYTDGMHLMQVIAVAIVGVATLMIGATRSSLRESEAHHRRIIDQVSEIIFTLDHNGTLTSLNPAFERITGWPAAAWVGRSLDGLLVEEERAAAASAIARAENLGSRVSVRHATVVKPDGSHVILEGIIVAHMIDGRQQGFLGSARDVTEREKAGQELQRSEQQLRETEERFRLLARATNDAAYDWDLKRDTLWWGEAHRILFGYPPDDEASVAAWKNRIHADDRERVWASVQTALATGLDTWSDEYRYRRSDGSYAIVLDRATISRDAEMKPVRVFGAMTDMTERKHLQEQLAQAKRVSSLGRVAASIAHEFNNVLMGIQPNLEVIRRRGAEDLRSPVDHILQSVRRGKRVTDEILRFTRPGAPGLQCVGVQSFFEKWSAENAPILGSSVELQLDFESDLYMTVDPLQVSQVFTNLALNARDALGERGGRLTISASLATSFGSFSFGVVKSADRYVHFRVHDDGCGMSKEQLAHVFEPLFTTKKKGTGLGLAISYQLVLQHEGYMFVESEPGAGSTFHVFLLAGSPVLHLVEQPASSEVAFKRILIVEDEVAVAAGIRTLLELDQVTVEAVHSGREAIPGIQRFRPDCVILDIGLPDISGTEVFVQVAARWPELPVVFSSGHADAAKLEPLLRVPTTALLLKPYDFDALRAALTRLSAARPRLQLASS